MCASDKTIFRGLAMFALLVCASAAAEGDEGEGISPLRPTRRPASRETIWGLSERDSFTVSVSISKQTTVQVEGQPEVVSRTNDQMELTYHVAQVMPNNDCLLVVQMELGDRTAGEKSPDAIRLSGTITPAAERQMVAMIVDSAGEAKMDSSTERQALIRALATADPSIEKLLMDSSPNEVIQGWLARPFWIFSRNAGDAAGPSWNRTTAIAMGDFGTLNVEAELESRPALDEYSSVMISGQGRFSPLVIPQTLQKQQSPLLRNVAVELDEFTGIARMWKPAEEATKEHRPLLEDMTVTIRFHGSAVLPGTGRDSEKPLTFHQTQVQSWLVTSHSVGLSDYRLAPVIPVDPR